MIKAVIFDMDGVLIDARQWHFKALNDALAIFGFVISDSEHEVTYNGLPTKVKLEILSSRKGLPRGLHSLISEIKQENTELEAMIHCRPIFVVQQTLADLKREGYKLAVASNSVKASIELFLSRSAISHYFQNILSNEDVHEPKPHPEMYQRAIANLGCLPNEVLVIEDSEIGIQSATSAGAHTLRVLSPQYVTSGTIFSEIKKIDAEFR